MAKRRLALAFLAGMATNLLLALWCGGESLTQAGIRLTAIEQGFHLAAQHWSFDAVPDAVRMAEAAEPAVKAVKRRK